jgi:hypothetical protein
MRFESWFSKNLDKTQKCILTTAFFEVQVFQPAHSKFDLGDRNAPIVDQTIEAKPNVHKRHGKWAVK